MNRLIINLRETAFVAFFNCKTYLTNVFEKWCKSMMNMTIRTWNNSASKVTRLPLKCMHHEVRNLLEVAIHIASSRNSYPDVFLLAVLNQFIKFAGKRPWWNSLLVKMHMTSNLQNNSFQGHIWLATSVPQTIFVLVNFGETLRISLVKQA